MRKQSAAQNVLSRPTHEDVGVSVANLCWRTRPELLMRATLEHPKPPRRHLEVLSTSGLLDLAGSYNLAYNPSMHEMVAHKLEGESFIFLLCF